MSEKICTRCHKPHDEDTKWCAACKAKMRVYDSRRVRPSGPGICRQCHKPFDEPHGFKTCNACREVNSVYNGENREKQRGYSCWYRKEYPEHVKVANHNCRARKKENGGTFTFRELNEQFERQEGFCYYCGKLLYASFESAVHVDHKTPLARGGSNDISNIALSCAACNLKKHTKTAEEFLQEMNK